MVNARVQTTDRYACAKKATKEIAVIHGCVMASPITRLLVVLTMVRVLLLIFAGVTILGLEISVNSLPIKLHQHQVHQYLFAMDSLQTIVDLVQVTVNVKLQTTCHHVFVTKDFQVQDAIFGHATEFPTTLMEHAVAMVLV
jgi:flagellar biosynthesis protein FlhB